MSIRARLDPHGWKNTVAIGKDRSLTVAARNAFRTGPGGPLPSRERQGAVPGQLTHLFRDAR